MMSARRIPFHPFIFAVYPYFFFCYRNNLSIFNADSLFIVMSALLIATLLLAVTSKLLKSTIAGANLTSAYMFAIFSYGHIYQLISGWTIAGIPLGSHLTLLAIYISALLFATLIFRGSHINHAGVFNFFQCTAVFLLAMVIIGLVQRTPLFTSNKITVQATLERLPDISPASTAASRIKPNIFFIILDAYANNSTLEQVYHYDNNDFIEQLRQKGFFVNESSVSNYAYTFLSLASSLNMQYLDSLSSNAGNTSRDETLLYPLISDNTVARLLKKEGYAFLYFDSGWAVSRDSDAADEVIRCTGLNEIQTVFLRTTILNPFVETLSLKGVRTRVLCTFEQLKMVGNTHKPPYFVLAHIVSPHPPFVFEADGSMPAQPGLSKIPKALWRKRFQEAYLSQLSFINTKVLDFIDVVQCGTNVRPIIILQADHGPAFPADLEMDPTETIIKERMGILNAIYVPKECKCNLDEKLTPVNVFRVIFDGCFGTRYSRLEDRSFYSRSDDPYRFIDVTDRLLGEGP
jgi:hypothetical protein